MKSVDVSLHTDQRCFDGCCWDFVHHVNPEYGVSKQNAGFEGDAGAAVWWQVEADNIH